MNIPPPSARLASIDRSQMLLHSIDVEKLIDEDHSARAIWQLTGRLDLSRYHAQIAAVEGHAGRDHTAPQLLISLWLYAYSQGVSSAREVARRCGFEPGFQWLCGLQPISHRTLSGFRSEQKEALDNLFVQVVGMLSAEGLITMQRLTLDGTKIKANASGNTFRRKDKLEAHLALAREQVEKMTEQAAEEKKTAKRRVAAKRRAARQRVSRLEAAFREVERLQQAKKHDRDKYTARASGTDPEAHVMRNGEGGTVPSYNVQLLTDTTHGLVVNVEATTDAIDYRQVKPALERCNARLGMLPKQLVADGDYTNHTSVQAAAASGVDFYGSWQDTWKPGEHDAHGRSGDFISQAFPYDAEHNVYTCPAGKRLTLHLIKKQENGVRTHVYKAPKAACRSCTFRDQCGPKKQKPGWRRSVTRSEEPTATTAFKTKMETEAAKQIYSRRSQIAEFPHAWIKERCGLRQFRCRGREKASMEAIWACLSYNIIRWFSIRRKLDAMATLAA
ncbi:MAG TPA: IS1182 family transposase [Acidobacteriaceae bacterium]